MNNPKPLSSKHKKAGVMCAYCRPKKVPASWRGKGIAWPATAACDKHKALIDDRADDRITEADYQSWMQL